jgi:hypothetical protein
VKSLILRSVTVFVGHVAESYPVISVAIINELYVLAPSPSSPWFPQDIYNLNPSFAKVTSSCVPDGAFRFEISISFVHSGQTSAS